jgi:tRNA A-37 threonylcarbamoyl transferase component Bud32
LGAYDNGTYNQKTHSILTPSIHSLSSHNLKAIDLTKQHSKKTITSTMSTSARNSKRTRNNTMIGSPSNNAIITPLCSIRQTVEQQEPVYYADATKMNNDVNMTFELPKTMSECTADTVTSSPSVYTSPPSMSMMRDDDSMCPVTGVYSNVTDDYFICPDILGKGHYGVVRECIHRATRQKLAVKSIEKSKINRLDHLQREIYLLSQIDHHGIMKMIECYEDADYVHIITEKYTGGELFDQIVKKTSSFGCFSERNAAGVIKSLLEAVAYLHDNGIVHRDIKPENILFESNEKDAAVKLIDFGLSRNHSEGETPMSNPVGTAYYMSPELLKGKYDNSCDMWSVGVVAYILLCGYPPFNGSSDSEIQDATRRGHLQFSSNEWITKSDDAKDFIKCLLRRDPRRRFTAKQALMHPWIRKMMKC